MIGKSLQGPFILIEISKGASPKIISDEGKACAPVPIPIRPTARQPVQPGPR